jgi:hypothetical protein
MQDNAAVLRRLRIVHWIALADALLLIALVTSSLTGRRDFVHVLGPLHGVNFLLLLTAAATAALDRLWGWWFPLAILLTAGPIGALGGARLIARQFAASGETTGAARARPGMESGEQS